MPTMNAWEVLAEPRRRRLVGLCSQRPRSVNELHRAMPEVTLGAVSQHLARLREAGLLTVQPAGRRRLYQVKPTGMEQLQRELDQMWASGLERLAHVASAAESR